MKKPSVIATLLLLALAACSESIPPVATVVPTPTLAAIPALAVTTAPTNMSLPLTATSDVTSKLDPQGQTEAEWDGIPIMPGALTGEGDEESYVFTIQATSQQVQEYYQAELGKLDWQALAEGDGEASLMLIFTNDAAATLSISIVTKGDEALVLLVKQGY